MMSLIPSILAVSISTGSLVNLLVAVAILCVVIWAVIALLRWAGLVIPPPVAIILTALVCIFLILFIARAFGLLLP